MTSTMMTTSSTTRSSNNNGRSSLTNGTLKPSPALVDPVTTESSDDGGHVIVCKVDSAGRMQPPLPSADFDEEAQRKKRQRAWTQLQALEQCYNSLRDRVLDQRERDLAVEEQAVREGSHRDYMTNAESIRTSRERALNVIDERYKVTRRGIESEFECDRRQAQREFVMRRSALRREMERQAIRQRLQLQQEFQQIERSRLGMQIRSMEHLWLLPALPALAASSVSAISAGDGNAPASTAHLLNQAAAVAPVYTHPPVVEQFEWQMRENYQLLTAYLNRRDEFGDFVPPPLRPHGLHSREIDSDLAFIRQAEFTLACEQQQQQPPPSPIVEAS